MGFEHAKFLYLLFLLPLIVFLIIKAGKKREDALKKFVGNTLISKLVSSLSMRKRKVKSFLLTAGMFFIIIALAGPQMGARLVEIKRKGVDIIVAVDCSKSMLAEDIKPNRLAKAKDELALLINNLKGDRIGIIAFSGVAFMQCPLTIDYEAAKMFLNLVDTSVVPVPGTAIGEAIKLATKSFSKKERKHKVLILLTDGEDHKSKPEEAAEEASKQGVRIYTVGIGEATGEPIPIRNKDGKVVDYHKDKNGEIVTSRLDERLLQRIALTTDGKYYHATSAEFDLGTVLKEVEKMEKKELKSRKQIRYENRYQIFAFLAFLCFTIEWLLSERKGGLI